MAGAIYSRMAGVAERLIDRFQQDGMQVVVSSVTPDPDPLKPPTVTETLTGYKAVARGISAQTRASDPLLKDASLQVIIDAAQGYVPQVGAQVSMSGQFMLVKRVDPIPALKPHVAYRFFLE